ncbi:hypothetical protein SOM61_10645 [Massilia sp. CFBP9012]|uniref:hypothetical protein n=1 Tax=Massilia sp. CFBP9012 TaxID=3096531 RepID=UPI002A699BB6|nr:hypothetical protein [Massilia sp. CFBP9012]MDY0975425.1 hypothetical protein [Massilia sp. CFBP9012]
MQRYANRSGQSGVVAYQIGADSITVEFTGGVRYVYTIGSAGASNIASMCKLAAEGRGLSTFISQHAHDRYDRRLD